MTRGFIVMPPESCRSTKRAVISLWRQHGRFNTIIIVEHKQAFINMADYLVEIGPGAGHYGGRLLRAEEVKRENTPEFEDDTPEDRDDTPEDRDDTPEDRDDTSEAADCDYVILGSALDPGDKLTLRGQEQII
jgi:hypothetical protein